MNFPNRIFAIGGAGKEIAYTILETDWVLEELIRPRPNPPSLTVTVIDSAEEELNEDKHRRDAIREHISELEDELRDPEKGRTGSVDIQYKLITDNIQLSSSIDLLGEDAVPRITAGHGMDEDDWWLREDYINENLDFAKGVVRKRGLGKAIYYKAYSEDDEISRYIDLPEKGRVAILAGLGGGTGSGIVLDLAQQLQEKQRTAEITLFGILPNHTEGLKESTNAFAALSELEYLHLQDENVFKDTVLVPIDPTNFQGKKGDRIQTAQFLQELDRAMVYLISSYYNTQGSEDPFSDNPKFAPFTIGIPQVLRYRVEAINQARESVRETLSSKEEAQQVEEEIYTSVQRFLDRHYSNQSDGIRELDETDLQNHKNSIEELLDFDLFNELTYESVSIFEDIIDDATSEGDSIAEQISLMHTSIRAAGTPGEVGTFVDDIDEHLGNVLQTQIQLLGQRKEIFERRQAINDKNIQDAIDFLLRAGDSSANAGVRLSKLETRIEDLESRREHQKEELASTTDELEELREEQSEKVERKLDNWEQEVEPPLRQFRKCDPDKIEATLGELQSKLKQFAGRIEAADSIDEVNQTDPADVKATLQTLEGELDDAGISFNSTRQDIDGSLTALKRAKEAHLKINKDTGIISDITPWETESEEDQKEGQKDYQVQRNQLEDRDVYEVGLPSDAFSVSMVFNGDQLLREVSSQQDELKEEIITALREQVEDLSQGHIREVRSELEAEPHKEELENLAEEAFWDDIGATDDLEERKAELESELNDIESDLDLYEPATDLFKNLSGRKDVWQKRAEEYSEQLAAIDDGTDDHGTQDDDYVYVKHIKPDDVFRATGSDDLADSDIVNSNEEARRIQGGLEELAENARDQQYTGLLRRKLSKGQQRYSDLRVRAAFLSQAIDQLDESMLDFEQMFRNAYDLGRSGDRAQRYTTWPAEIGGPWDIGFSVFINGVFLDNIRKVVQADGYYDGYEERHKELDDDILIHHNYGLEDGYFVRRNNLLNMAEDSDVEFFLDDESTVVENLLTESIEQVYHTTES
jgi:hypothetical protein